MKIFYTGGINMKKKMLTLTLALILAISTITIANGVTGKAKVMLNNVEISADVKIINGKPYIDASTYSEALGVDAVWDSKGNVLKVASASDDVIIPEIVRNTSPCVVGIIGTFNDGSYSQSTYSKNIAHGTGIIIKSTGEILTNAHVVKDLDKIVVVLTSGDGYIAKLKYIDEESDLAVVSIDKKGLPVAKFGKDSEIVTGKTVIAIGIPISFSLRNSASTGIISGVNRGIDSYYKLIQTDAAINPGNSGGPLVSMKGNVIGINSSKFAGEGIEGLCFSIPVNTVTYVLSQFDRYGYVKRPYIGAAFEEDWAAMMGLPSNKGLTITGFENDSPAQKSGLQKGDIIMKVGNTYVNTIVDYNEAMKKYLPGSREDFYIKRGVTNLKINVTFGEKTKK